MFTTSIATSLFFLYFLFGVLVHTCAIWTKIKIRNINATWKNQEEDPSLPGKPPTEQGSRTVVTTADFSAVDMSPNKGRCARMNTCKHTHREDAGDPCEDAPIPVHLVIAE